MLDNCERRSPKSSNRCNTVSKTHARLDELRSEYSGQALREQDVDPDAMRQFERWFGEACQCGAAEPNVMTLATATQDGRPSARLVLLRGISERGFSFFTNYESRKARELEANPNAALVFFCARSSGRCESRATSSA